MVKKLGWNEKAQQFYREIGKRPNGKAYRAYLIDLDPPDDVKDKEDLATWISELRDYFPQIQIRLKPDVAAAAKTGARERLGLAEKDAEEEQASPQDDAELRDYTEPHEGKNPHSGDAIRRPGRLRPVAPSRTSG